MTTGKFQKIMIRLENISKVFYTKEIQTKALDGVSLSVARGEFVSIMGPSGCGKATLLNVMGLLDMPTEGELYIDGILTRSMEDFRLSRLRNEKIGFIFQSFHLIPAMSVLDNVTLPMLYRKNVPSRNDIRLRAEALLEKVGLENRMNHFPSQLSGGQCQRAAIARALMGGPEVLLADEPTGNLDSRMGAGIMELLLSLNSDGMTIVMVTHDERIAGQTGRRIMMEDGRITG